MLKHGEVNPLNVHSLRKIDWCPPHFECVQFDLRIGEKTITDWIYENLEGRFYFGQIDVRESLTSPTHRKTLVGFEYPGEASYFSLHLTQLNSYNDIW